MNLGTGVVHMQMADSQGMPNPWHVRSSHRERQGDSDAFEATNANYQKSDHQQRASPREQEKLYRGQEQKGSGNTRAPGVIRRKGFVLDNRDSACNDLEDYHQSNDGEIRS